MAKMIKGLTVAEALKLLKQYGYEVWWYCDEHNEFGVDNGQDDFTVRYDSALYVI